MAIGTDASFEKPVEISGGKHRHPIQDRMGILHYVTPEKMPNKGYGVNRIYKSNRIFFC